ncbi:hypothetical protein [Virgibacillus sp. SK37]|uniref:hypothetical protein n=1 Tax=Virgibacillus sp. SK37 TaxID=403957 RepID=UPI0004D13720|nr:hypothetical protein [Virgibacillus sp. SK37]AIF45660.1 hypothetical protein X953_18905 [Virgibacillus sp. SK37]
MNYIKQINRRPKYLILLVGMYSVMISFFVIGLFPFLYIVSDMTINQYCLFISGILLSSGVLFHLLLTFVYKTNSKKYIDFKKERRLDTVSILVFNIVVSPLVGFIIYKAFSSVDYGAYAWIIFSYGSLGWLMTVQMIRKPLKEKEQIKKRINKTWKDKEGNLHLLFK